MTLTTHTIVGLGLASLVPPGPWQPIIVLSLSLAGHYAIDMIPHWDYTPPFLIKDEKNKMNTRIAGGRHLWVGSFEVLADLLLGITLGGMLFYDPSRLSLFSAALAVAGSIAPDVLQSVYFTFRREPWTSLQKFHDFFHSGRRIDLIRRGVIWQAVFILIFVIIVGIL